MISALIMHLKGLGTFTGSLFLFIDSVRLEAGYTSLYCRLQVEFQLFNQCKKLFCKKCLTLKLGLCINGIPCCAEKKIVTGRRGIGL